VFGHAWNAVSQQPIEENPSSNHLTSLYGLSRPSSAPQDHFSVGQTFYSRKNLGEIMDRSQGKAWKWQLGRSDDEDGPIILRCSLHEHSACRAEIQLADFGGQYQ